MHVTFSRTSSQTQQQTYYKLYFLVFLAHTQESYKTFLYQHEILTIFKFV